MCVEILFVGIVQFSYLLQLSTLVGRHSCARRAANVAIHMAVPVAVDVMLRQSTNRWRRIAAVAAVAAAATVASIPVY